MSGPSRPAWRLALADDGEMAVMVIARRRDPRWLELRGSSYVRAWHLRRYETVWQVFDSLGPWHASELMAGAVVRLTRGDPRYGRGGYLIDRLWDLSASGD
jgi:hypothetical protein